MSETRTDPAAPTGERREFLSRLSIWSMRAAIAGAYGLFGLISVRFLYPARPARREWMFVAEVDRLKVGGSLLYRGPAGETVNVTRREAETVGEGFVALSSTCPHLGCQVHWEPHNNRFFCPCHNGEFDPEGTAYAGPPGDAGQSLPRYPIKVVSGLLYIEMPVETLTAQGAREPGRTTGEVIAEVPGIHAAGHDPCLANRRLRRRIDGSVA